MIADSCNCCGANAQGCKIAGRLTSMTWCSICDHNKSRRKCHSEGMYQESDPLKELNRCCDKGCDYIHSIHSSHYSQIKKSDLESEEKKLLCSDNIEMEIGDVYHGIKKHHTKPHKEKCFSIQKSSAYHTFHQEITGNSGLPNTFENSRKLPIGVYHRTKDINVEKINSNFSKHENFKSGLLKYHCNGDAPDMELPSNKPLSYSEQDKYSSEMRERYIREMEILRSKLNLLKGEMVCDGKRLRQRSESEPGFLGVAGGVPKRARDNSPKFKYECRKLPASPLVNYNKFLNKQISKCQESKRVLSCKLSSPTDKISNTMQEVNNFHKRKIEAKNKGDSSDSDLDGSICDEELANQEVGGVIVNEDDDCSVLSSTTSASNGSNTPSQVGETLGSITLNETSKKELTCQNSSQIQPVNSDLPKPVPMQVTEFVGIKQDLEVCSNPFRVSLFSNVPPYVKFFMHDFKGPTLPLDITRQLKWKLTSITPIIIRRTLTNSGFKLVRSESTRGNFDHYYNFIYNPPHRVEDSKSLRPCRSRSERKNSKESNDWTGQWGKHMKSFVFKTLKDFQKLNHFPGTFQIGRKDKLWKNLFRLMVKFGKKEFGFIPKTYILPQDSKLLRTAWEKASGLGKGQWIVKPPAAARGTGIKVVHKWGQIPKKRPLIVQKYIAKPYLINGSKFDLRLYVLMTSIHPLRIYLYDDGLVRFASVKYSEDVECLSDRFMHLTNYSINKLSTQYCANEDASSCRGHKWTLKALWTYLTKQGVNVKLLRKNLIDLVIKTIISGESNINILSKNNLPSRYCSYELFGIDVLLDHTLKPWLLEVNISPSLHSASPLDLAVKGPLVRELLNIAGFQIPGNLTKEQEENFLETYGLKDKTHSFCYDKRIYWTALGREERLKQETHQVMSRDEYLNSILEDLTPDDVRHLIQFEDELTQLSRFEKVFPTPKTYSYHQFFESPRYYNMMLDAWESKYHNNRTDGIKLLESLCQQKTHLIISFPGSKIKPSRSQSDLGSQVTQEGKSEPDSDCEKETQLNKEAKKYELKQEPSVTTDAKKTKLRSVVRASAVSKPVVRTSFSLERRVKARLSPKPNIDRETKDVLAETKNESPDTDCSYKLLTEVQGNTHKLIPDSKLEMLKQYPSCKLENSISESLNNGKNIASPKHIHSTCIKMNISS